MVRRRWVTSYHIHTPQLTHRLQHITTNAATQTTQHNLPYVQGLQPRLSSLTASTIMYSVVDSQLPVPVYTPNNISTNRTPTQHTSANQTRTHCPTQYSFHPSTTNPHSMHPSLHADSHAPLTTHIHTDHMQRNHR